MSNFGYNAGQPFGDPSRFTRSTGEDELDRFNQWMRSQPWYQEQRARMGTSVDEGEADYLRQALEKAGIPLPKDFHIDEGGNLNQKSRTGRNLKIAGLVGGAALGGLGLAGMGPLSGLLGGSAGASAAAAPAAAGLSEAVIPTTLGLGGGLGAAAGGGAAAATSAAASGGMGIKKLLGLGGLGMGLDLAGSYLSPSDNTDTRVGFLGKKASNGVSLDPGEVYGQGLGALQELMPMMKQKVFSPTKLRPMEGAGGDFQDAADLFKRLGF